MAQEIEKKMKNLRTQMTQLVSSGEDEDGTILRRLLAELDRLENRLFAIEPPSLDFITGGFCYYVSGGKHVGTTL